LGGAHTISYWSNNEVHEEIKELAKDKNKIVGLDVIQWAMKNSIKSLDENFGHYNNQGLEQLNK
jgi:hypothetical protein